MRLAYMLIDPATRSTLGPLPTLLTLNLGVTHAGGKNRITPVSNAFSHLSPDFITEERDLAVGDVIEEMMVD